MLSLCKSVTTHVLNLVYRFQCPYFRKDIVELQNSTDNQTVICSSDFLAIQTSCWYSKVPVFPVLEWT